MTNYEAKTIIANQAMLLDTKMQSKEIEAFLMATQALEQIDKIIDLIEGTIDHFDYDDAMDLLYEIKRVIK